MGKRGFIAYDPYLARKRFNADLVVTIYYLKLLRYDVVLKKDEEGFFTRSARQIEGATCITRRQQERARKWLEEHAFITTAVKPPYGSIGPQLHFQIIDKNRPL